jgi:hypothetical protein
MWQTSPTPPPKGRVLSGCLAGRDAPRARRKFSLKSLFVLTTCVCLAFAFRGPALPVAVFLLLFISIGTAMRLTSNLLDWAARRSAFTQIPVSVWVLLSMVAGVLICALPLIAGLCVAFWKK